MKKKILIDLCKCNYCGSMVITCNDKGQCPRGCPGNMKTIQASVFEIDTEKTFHHNIELNGNFYMNKEYDEVREIISNE
jgi:hypothetical protein